MQLSLSCRICEGFLSKEEATMSFYNFAKLASMSGYDGICMRASQIGVQHSRDEIRAARECIDELGLRVTMVTGDFDIVYNNAAGPNSLRNIEPYLELAGQLGASMLRVCMKSRDDIPHARTAAQRAAEKGMHLVHQCHAESLFETVDEIVATMEQIDHPNFGLVFEAGNLEECGQTYGSDTIQQLAPWIRNVYLQNQRLSPKGAVTLNTWTRGPVSFDVIPIPHAGGIEFRTVFEGMKKIGYDDLFTVHQAGPEGGPSSAMQDAKETATYLRQLHETVSAERP